MSDFPDFATPIELIGQKQSITTHKVALMLAMTETPFTFRIIDLLSGAQKSAEYETLNPFGRVPTLIQGDLVLRQSPVMLRYLARRTGQFGYADETEEYAVENWFGFSYDYFSFGLARVRYINRFMGGEPQHLKDFFRPNMLRGMDLIERHLADHAWLALERPTLAEFVCHPMVSVWRDAELDIADYPATAAWLERFQALPGWHEPEAMLADRGGAQWQAG